MKRNERGTCDRSSRECVDKRGRTGRAREGGTASRQSLTLPILSRPMALGILSQPTLSTLSTPPRQFRPFVLCPRGSRHNRAPVPTAQLRQQGRVEAACLAYQSIDLRDANCDTELRYHVTNGLGIVQMEMHQLKRAKASFEEAITLKPESTEALHNLAVTCQAMDDMETAESYFARALAIDPELVPAAVGRAECLLILERFHEAFAVIGPRLAQEPESFRLLFLQVRACLVHGSKGPSVDNLTIWT